MILCFSGTGNGLYISGRIAEATGDEIISLNDRIKTADYSSITAERLIFVVPTYGWRIPRVVEQWIGKTDFGSRHPCIFHHELRGGDRSTGEVPGKSVQ